MTYTAETARDAVMEVVNTAWVGDPETSPFLLEWFNVRDDTKAEATTGKPSTYGAAIFQTQTGENEFIGRPVKYLNQGTLRVRTYTPPGDGNLKSDRMTQVVKNALRLAQLPDLWFFDVAAVEIGVEGSYFRHDVVASVRYAERHG